MFGEEGFTRGLLSLYESLGISKRRFSGDGIYIGRRAGGFGRFFSGGKARRKVRKDENKIAAFLKAKGFGSDKTLGDFMQVDLAKRKRVHEQQSEEQKARIEKQISVTPEKQKLEEKRRVEATSRPSFRKTTFGVKGGAKY